MKSQVVAQPSIAILGFALLIASVLPGSNLCLAQLGADNCRLNADKVFGNTKLHGQINCIAFSPDGKRLIGATENSIDFWDAKSGDRVDTLPLSLMGNTAAMAFSPNNQYVAIGGDRGNLLVIDLATRTEVFAHKGEFGHLQSTTGIAFFPDARRIITCGSYHRATILDTATGDVLNEWKLDPHHQEQFSVTFSPSGHLFALAGDSNVRIYDAKTNQELHNIEAYSSDSGGVEFLSDDEVLTFGSDRVVLEGKDGKEFRNRAALRVWNVETGEMVREFTDKNEITSGDALCLSPDRTKAIVKVTDEVRIYDVATGEVVCRTGPLHTNWWTISFDGLAVSPDGSTIALAGDARCVRLFDTTTGSRLLVGGPGHDNYITCVAPSPDSERLATFGDGLIHIWNATTAELVVTLECGPHIFLRDGCWSPDGKLIYAVGAYLPEGRPDRGRLFAFDTRTGAKLQEIETLREALSCAVSPDGQQVAVAAGSSLRQNDEDPEKAPYAEVFAARTGRPLMKLSRPGLRTASRLAFSADGKWLTWLPFSSPTDPASVTIWDLESQTVASEAELDQGDALRTSVDGSRAAARINETTALILDSNSGEPIRKISVPEEEYLATISISPDGKSLATVAWPTKLVDGIRRPAAYRSINTIRIWNLGNGEVVQVIKDVEGRFSQLRFSPDGNTLYGGFDTGVVAAWKIN